MAIRNPQPPVIDGITYDLLGLHLGMSTAPSPEGMKLHISVTFYPYREGANGPEILDIEQAQSTISYGDAQAAALSNPILAQFLTTLETAGQNFITASI